VVSAGAITYADDINDIADATTGKPLVRLVQTVAQSIPDATLTALTFSGEDIDTHGFHDTGSNTARITPTMAGYYRFTGTYFTAAPTTLANMDASLRKNGSTSIAPGPRGSATGNIAQSQSCTAMVSCNGTTDYVELLAFQDSTGAVNSNVSQRFSSVFECEFIRPL